MQSQSNSERKHLETELAELQRSYEAWTKRIQAIDIDLGREDDSEKRQNLEERKKELIDEREEVVANLKKTEEELKQFSFSVKVEGSKPASEVTTTESPVPPTPTKSIWDPRRIRLSLGAFALALILCIVAAYVLTLLWVIPQRVPVLSDPLINAALTVQPPRPHLLAENSTENSTIVNRLVCVKPGKSVSLSIAPEPSASEANKYFWQPIGGNLAMTDEAVFWKRQFTPVVITGTASAVMVQLCEIDRNTGTCGQQLDYLIFAVQEVCFK